MLLKAPFGQHWKLRIGTDPKGDRCCFYLDAAPRQLPCFINKQRVEKETRQKADDNHSESSPPYHCFETGWPAGKRAHLAPFFLLFLLGEDRVHPPDLGEHAAVAQAKT